MKFATDFSALNSNRLNQAFLKGTRVPVSTLFDYLLAGDNIKDFLDDFPTVSFNQVKHALQYAEISLEKNAA